MLCPEEVQLSCGDNIISAGEDCDGTEDDACPGLCDPVFCQCPLLVDLASFTGERTKRGVQLSWTTVAETNNAGFRVLRGRDFDRDLEIMTQPMIPARGTELSGATYTWLDDSTQRSGGVYYYLEDVDLNGTVTRHGPVIIDMPAPMSKPGTVKPGARP